jgi:hypothetical protein
MLRVTVVVLAALTLLAPSVAQAADELSTSDQLDARRFVTSGPRAYDVGTEARRYPAMGFQTRGEMAGIWSPPLKLLDGIWFGVDGAFRPRRRSRAATATCAWTSPCGPASASGARTSSPASRAAC